MTARELKIARARLFYGGFYKCPTTGRIIEGLRGDDKVLCACRRSNPRVPQERTEQTGVHIVRFLDLATAEDYVDQEERRRQDRLNNQSCAAE